MLCYVYKQSCEAAFWTNEISLVKLPNTRQRQRLCSPRQNSCHIFKCCCRHMLIRNVAGICMARLTESRVHSQELSVVGRRSLRRSQLPLKWVWKITELSNQSPVCSWLTRYFCSVVISHINHSKSQFPCVSLCFFEARVRVFSVCEHRDEVIDGRRLRGVQQSKRVAEGDEV